jgi:hypothetical protein
VTNTPTAAGKPQCRPVPNPRIVPARDAGNFAAYVEAFRQGRAKSDQPLGICHTPPVLMALGAPDGPVTICAGMLWKAMHEHRVSADLLKHLPAELYDPIMVFDSATQPNSLVVMTALRPGEQTVVVAIHLGKRLGRREANEIASVHPRASDAHFTNWIRQGLLRYRNNELSLKWFQSAGLQLPLEGTTRSSNERILDETNLVKS